MNALRWLVLPISWLYGIITFFRNKFYDWGIFSSYKIPGKSIVVGNLSVGGTGKTPHVAYLIEHFLKQEISIATLSRGYGRASTGVIRATPGSNPSEIGDEPTQYKSRYGNKVEVVVAEKRKKGIEFIQQEIGNIDLILLDDAFQHRAVQAGLTILITPYDQLFTNDHMLPTGNLREWPMGKKRADCIIVSKAPISISQEEKNKIIQQLAFGKKPVFFSSLQYGELVPIHTSQAIDFKHALIVTGIGNPTPLIEFWKTQISVEHMAFPDHHNFTSKDIMIIHEKFDTFASRDKVIITTEKDYMRLREFQAISDEHYAWHYQPITVLLNNQQTFKSLLDEYYSKV
ncbi:MAG: tetraacyldisaccharide 4'-kinase [Crocinitomicaceae bacterium]|jgi:tetraacyldisaccharide 4'-kinase